MTEKRLAWGGILAPFVFVLTMLVFSLLTPTYNNLTQAISELGARGAPYALAVNIVGFMGGGLLIMVYAWGLYLGIRPSSGAVVVPLLVGISGIGWLGLGLFPAEAGFQPSTNTTLHFSMVAVNYLPFILAAFIFAVMLRTDAYWRRWIPFSITMGLLAIASFFIPGSIPLGLSQRLGLGAYFVWLFVTGLALLRKPAPSRE